MSSQKDNITSKNKEEVIYIKKAKTHNLNDISLKIKKNKITVISGVSGSGKSSLAFHTLFAEGQRRYIESLSSYARQFLGKIQKPNVEEIIGICPAIAVEQKTIINNPRSTISTNSEIYDYLKILFSRIGKTISPISKKEVKKHKINDIVKFIKSQHKSERVIILTKIYKKDEKSILNISKKGFSKIYVNKKIQKIKELKKGDFEEIKKQDTYTVIDRIPMQIFEEKSTIESVETAFLEGMGECFIKTDEKTEKFSDKFERDNMIFKEPNINLFSFNNPYGACSNCQGFGSVLGIDKNKVITNTELSIYQGVVNCWSGKKLSKWKERFIKNSLKYNFPIHRSYKKLTEKEKEILWNGKEKCKGINQFFKNLEKDKYKIQNRVLIARYRGKTKCSECNGSRLRKEALYVKIQEKNIAEITNMTIKEALHFFKNMKLIKEEKIICKRILKEIIERLDCLSEIGLGYLKLNRNSNTLSGGESQRINITKSIGSSLVGSMYILDEPSIGLHSKDTYKLINILKKLRDIGNTVIIVEHDEEIIKQADEIIDIGAGAGIYGGNIVFQGNISTKKIDKNSLTLQYIYKKKKIPIPEKRKKLEKKNNYHFN